MAKKPNKPLGDEIDPALGDTEAAVAAFAKTPGARATIEKHKATIEKVQAHVRGTKERAYLDGLDNSNKAVWTSSPETAKAWNAGRRDIAAGKYNVKAWR